MENKKYKPKIDKLFFIIFIPTAILMLGCTILAYFEPMALFIIIPTDLFTFYFLISPLFGYVELMEDRLFIKFGFVIKREIPYSKIRGTAKERSFIAETMLSLKNAFEHVKIRYNTYDVTIVSVTDNDDLINELYLRCKQK